ncbi:MAG: glycosyltransferase family 9 protein [Candidatus Glassbacteria bacterium]
MAIGIRERAAEFLTGASSGTPSELESLPITAILRNPRRVLIIPGPHIEDIILLEPFAHSTKVLYPDAYIVLLVPDRFLSLAIEMECIDKVIPLNASIHKKGSCELDRLKSELTATYFDVALAVSFEAEQIVRALTASSGAKIKIGFQEIDRNGLSCNVVLRDRDRDQPYQRRIEKLFSLLGVKRIPHFKPVLTRERDEAIYSLDYLRERHGEPIIGFYFDQLDPLDQLKEEELEKAVRVIVKRRNQKSIIAGYGLQLKQLKPFTSDGARIIEDATLVKLIALFSDCSWVITNSFGFTILMGEIGRRVVFLGKPKRLTKFPLNRLTSVTFLPVVSGRILQDSLVRVMEEKYPGE